MPRKMFSNPFFSGRPAGGAGGMTFPFLFLRVARSLFPPDFNFRKDKSFVAGGAAGKLLLNKKGWLGHDEVVLHKGEGPVSAIAWR